MQSTDRYLDAHQARQRAPTPYEDLLGDAIERAFAAGVTELPALVEHLNRSHMTTPSGTPWTEENYRAEMARLGA